jgi:hypothetical protein
MGTRECACGSRRASGALTRRPGATRVSVLVVALLIVAAPAAAGDLADLARPQDGRSMRATSSHRIGPDGTYDPKGELDPDSNRDNQSVPPGETKVLMEEDGPGVITHVWMTFLGPELHPWARDGSANHQEMLLRVYYDGNDRPGVEAPVGDFFANCFGRYQATLNGVGVGGVLDFYRAETDNWEYHLLDFWPDPGTYRLRLECVGRNAASTGYGLGIESVRLRERRPRVAEWAHERDEDWREHPVLHR